jgi:NAD(P)-dependent dehydrogenase (short-subunit alcohol dehydrogenase family)
MKYGAIYPSLKGRTVLVTGGGSGIGESIVEHFAAQGAKVGFLDIKEKESKALAARLKRKRQIVHFEPCDLTDIAALRKAIKSVRKSLGPITILVNNAAHDERHTLEEVTPEYFDERIKVNLKHQFFAIQEVAGDMRRAKNGAIVNMGSTSWMVAFGGLPVYTAAKAGVIGLTRSAAKELAGRGVCVNAIAPGFIETDMTAGIPENERERLKGAIPLGRLGSADDIAEAVAYLAGPAGSYITGQTLVVDGGLSL